MKFLRTLMAASVIVLGAVSCSSEEADQVACDQVEQQLEAAQKRADESSGTPNGPEAEEEVESLQERQKECASASTTTSSLASTTSTTMPTVDDVVVNTDSLAEGFADPSDVDPVTELAFGDEASAAMDGAAEERSARSHSQETLTTVEELTGWLNDASNPDAVPVRERVVAAITTVCGEADVNVHLEQNKGWLLMVVRPPSQIMGTSYMTESGLLIATNWRQVGENDAYWLPVCTQGENKGDVAWDGVVRADCGNAHKTPKIRINRPNTPDVPPVETPPGSPCPYNPALPVDSPDCLRPKNPSADVNVNPDVPPGVRGPGSTPVGEDPGPAEEPVDTPSGCVGSCPTPTTEPDEPPSNPPDTVPACGQPGTPSCDDTDVTPPSTVAPPPSPPDTSSPDDTIPSP